jgi:hypothetical protein
MNTGKLLWWDPHEGVGVLQSSTGTKYFIDASVIDSETQKKLLGSDSILFFEENYDVEHTRCAKNISFTPSLLAQPVKKQSRSGHQLAAQKRRST